MDTDRLKDLAPHYVAMFVLVLIALEVVRLAIGEISFWLELAIIVVVVFSYRPLVMRLGVGPDSWQ